MRLSLFVGLLFGVLLGLGTAPIAWAQEPIRCGPGEEKHEIIKHKGHYPVPKPSPGKSLIVIGVGKSFTKSYQQKLAVNGVWRAVLKESQYSFFETEPGIVKLCWGGRVAKRDDNYLLITARPNEIYYVRGTLRGILELDPVDAQKFLEKKTYVTYEVRQ